jgi:two-component system sensor histidine kinase PilS (NtrC family)
VRGERLEDAAVAGLDALRRRLAYLIGARLALCVAILGVALLVTAQTGGQGFGAGERRLYATVVFAFSSTILFAALNGRVRRIGLFAGLQIATDVAVVTVLVHVTGGVESIFGFLYVPITVYAALVLGRRGAYGASVLSACAYGAVLLLATGWDGAAGVPAPVQGALFGVHAGALLLVALLASALSHERDRADQALDERTLALRRLQRLHERTVESLTSGLLTTDALGRITSFNPEAERITGIAAAEALGRTLADVIPGAPEVVFDAGGRGERGERARARLRFRSRGGQELHLGIAGSVLRGADGGGAGHVVIFQDVSRVVEMEGELRRQERLAAVGQLSAHLAHEIRNPLAAISGSIQVLDATLPCSVKDDETRRLLDIAVREADRLNRLITDFLQFARPGPSKRTTVSVALVVEEVLHMLDSVCPPSVRVSLDAPRELRVLADENQLRQLLWNLLLNALQALPDGGSVDVTVAQVPAQAPAAGDRRAAEEGTRWVEIEVADTGAGIPEDVLDHIFDPFFTTKKEGTGLGLATVHRIVEGHGGHLAVESVVGAGTRFRIRLPHAEAA